MSRFYTNFSILRNKFHVRGYEDGKQFFETHDYHPSIFLLDHGLHDSPFRNIDGQFLKQKKFDSPRDAKDFVKQYDGIESFPIFGFPNFEYPAIAEMFPGNIEYDPNIVRSFILDIEVNGSVEVEPGVYKSAGFPNPMDARFPINAISVVYKDRCICFGIGEFDVNNLTEKYELPITFKGFQNEFELLSAFLNFWNLVQPDIVSGWNIEGFDIPYIINRMNQILGEDRTKQLSPYGQIRSRTFTGKFGKEEVSFNIEGVAILDYLQLYQKHTFVTRESYKLDHIAFVELEERKIEYEGNLFTLYYENPQLFFEYNCKDSILVKRLDSKLGLLALVMNMSYFAKVNYQDTFSPVRLWDVIISSRLLEEGVVVPYSTPRVAATPYEGAYVKDPIPGRIGWGFSVDMNSMYPLKIRSFNIGPDTYVKPEYLTEELRKLRETVIISGVDSLVAKKVDTSILKKYNYAMTANGEFYRRDHEGILSRLVKELYEGRTSDKKDMLKAKSRYEEVKNSASEDEIEKLLLIIAIKGTSQGAKKVLLNSLYGALANEHFRFYRTKDAEAITLTGQQAIKLLGNSLSDFISSVVGVNENHYHYGDTDSVYLEIQSFVDKVSSKVPDDKMVDFLDKFIETKIQPEINRTLDGLSEYMNAFQNAMGAKRECIFSSGIWCCHPDTTVVVDGDILRIEDLYESQDLEIEENVKVCSGILHNISEKTLTIKEDNIELVMRRWYSGEMYTFETESGNIVSVTGEHLMFVYRDGEYKWIKASMVLETDTLLEYERETP